MVASQQRTRYLQLPFLFDIERLNSELALAQSFTWIDHFNTNCYEKRWTCLPLRSVDGCTDHILSLSNENFLDTDFLKQCPYFQEILNQFECEKTSVRLMSLEAGGIIKPHRDKGTSFEDGLARLHIPILTNAAVEFVIDGETIHFARGHTWYLNAACEHAVYNRSSLPRIHLMLDCIANDWLHEVFYKAGFVPNNPPKYNDPSINDNNVLEIIEQLRSLGNLESLKFADNLRSIYDKHHA